MFDDIPLAWLGPGSGWAVVGLFVIAMARGALMPRVSVDRERRLLERARDDALAAHRNSELARGVQSEQLGEVVGTLRTISDTLRSETRSARHAAHEVA